MTSQNNCMAGIKFPHHEGAILFLREVLHNIPRRPEESNFSNVSSPILKRLPGSGSIMKKKICKEEISTPCMFTHVTGTIVTKSITDKSNSTDEYFLGN